MAGTAKPHLRDGGLDARVGAAAHVARAAGWAGSATAGNGARAL